jgi:acylpyruvate hydrolase
VRLVNYRWRDTNRLGAEVGGWIVDLVRACRQAAHKGEIALPSSTIELFRGAKGAWQTVEQAYNYVLELMGTDPSVWVSNDFSRSAEEVEFLPPVLSPGKILGVGMNYMHPRRPDSKPEYPVLFLKPGISMTGHQQPIKIPPVTQAVKIEGELAVVIGERGKHLSRDEALTYVAGYTIANDVTASDLEKRTSQWATGKILDTFTPVGPYLVTVDEVDNPNNLRIKTTLNERVVQDANTIEMIFNVAELVSYISTITTLEPGDLILTGSPKRNAEVPVDEIFIHPGDHIAIEIENLGVLANFVIEETDSSN